MSQSSVADTSEMKIHMASLRIVAFSPLLAFVLVQLQQLSCFLALSACLAPGQLLMCQLVATGTVGRRASWKKEGGVSLGLCKHISFCPSAWQGKKGLPTHYCVAFVQFGGGRNVGCKLGFVYHALVCMQAFCTVLEKSIRWPILPAKLSPFTSIVL